MYKQRVAKILADRPETDLQLCPRAASWEFVSEEDKGASEGGLPLDEQQREALLNLGQQRGAAVKQ